MANMSEVRAQMEQAFKGLQSLVFNTVNLEAPCNYDQDEQFSGDDQTLDVTIYTARIGFGHIGDEVDAVNALEKVLQDVGFEVAVEGRPVEDDGQSIRIQNIEPVVLRTSFGVSSENVRKLEKATDQYLVDLVAENAVYELRYLSQDSQYGISEQRQGIISADVHRAIKERLAARPA